MQLIKRFEVNSKALKRSSERTKAKKEHIEAGFGQNKNEQTPRIRECWAIKIGAD